MKKRFLGSSDGKDTGCKAGNSGSIPGSGRSPGERNGNPLQYSCLENPMDRPRGHKKLDMTEQLTLIYIDYSEKTKTFKVTFEYKMEPGQY